MTNHLRHCLPAYLSPWCLIMFANIKYTWISAMAMCHLASNVFLTWKLRNLERLSLLLTKMKHCNHISHYNIIILFFIHFWFLIILTENAIIDGFLRKKEEKTKHFCWFDVSHVGPFRHKSTALTRPWTESVALGLRTIGAPINAP